MTLPNISAVGSAAKNKSMALLASVLVAGTPFLVFAQANNFKGLVQIVIGLIQDLIPLVVALTLLVFIWGIFQLVRSNSEDSRAEAIAVITYGIVSLFVMVSVWGLVNILVRSVNLDNTAPPAPGLPNPGGYFQPTS